MQLEQKEAEIEQMRGTTVQAVAVPAGPAPIATAMAVPIKGDVKAGVAANAVVLPPGSNPEASKGGKHDPAQPNQPPPSSNPELASRPQAGGAFDDAAW